MIQPSLNTNAGTNDLPPPISVSRSQSQKPKFDDLPDIYHFPKRKSLPPMVVAGIGFIAAGALFYGAQAYAPTAFKPATLVGSYDSEIQEARKAGELEAQIRYDAQLRQVEVQYQAQLKEVETLAANWQEQYRTAMSGYTEHYRATWNRANIYAQAAADIQKQYMAIRGQLASESLRGHTKMANMATTFGLFAGLFDPELERQSLDYANRVRQQAFSLYDRAAQSGVTVTVDGWDDGLVHPDNMAQAVFGIVPFRLPPSLYRRIEVPTLSEAQ